MNKLLSPHPKLRICLQEEVKPVQSKKKLVIGICAAAAVELGKTVGKNEARLRADYDLTFREIVRRLKAEKDGRESSDE